MAANADLRPFQSSGALGIRLGRPELECRGRCRQIPSTSGVVLDLHGDAVELDEEDRARASGVAGVDRAPRRPEGQAVHHLHRGRSDPGGDDPRDRGAGRVHSGEAGEQRAYGLRRAEEHARDRRRDPERPFGADDDPDQVGPGGSSALPPRSTTSPSGSTSSSPGHVVDREAVLEQWRRRSWSRRCRRWCRPAGSTGPARSRTWSATARVTSRFDARLHHDAAAREVELEDAAHARERDHDAVGDRSAPPDRPVPAPRATNGTRSLMAGAEPLAPPPSSSGDDDLGMTRWPVSPSHS